MHRMKSKRKNQSLVAATIFLNFLFIFLFHRFKCIFPYPPNSEFELELAVGDIVYVHKKRDNGWYKGTHQKNGKVGLFPSSFVEPDI